MRTILELPDRPLLFGGLRPRELVTCVYAMDMVRTAAAAYRRDGYCPWPEDLPRPRAAAIESIRDAYMQIAIYRGRDACGADRLRALVEDCEEILAGLRKQFGGTA